MRTARRPIGYQLADDPFIKGLSKALFVAPLAIALTLFAHAMTRDEAPARPAAVAAEARAPIEKPIMTHAVLRPRIDVATRAAFEAPASQAQLLAMAFMPGPDSTLAATLRPASAAADGRDLPTASTGQSRAIAHPRAEPEGRAWRVRTLQKVGVADGLRLVSEGGILQLAGVQPLAEDATCKRLDGVLEPCSRRALSRLEVLTRGRVVTCRVYETAAGEAPVARCRADKIDIAEDLVRNGLARRGDA